MKNSILFLFFLITQFGFSNTTITISKQINWSESPIIHNPTGNFETTIWAFENATYSDIHPTLPIFSETSPVSSSGKVRARLTNTSFESFDKTPSEDDEFLSNDIVVHTKVMNARGQHFIHYYFIPIRKTTSGNFERLVSFDLILEFEAVPIAQSRNDYTYTSELSDGDIYKIAVSETGMHKLTYDFLKNDLELDIDNIDPRKIRILGQHGGLLPENIDDPRIDDLEELKVRVIGEDDGSFDSEDYIIFYAEGANKWKYDADDNTFRLTSNHYTDLNYYFIKVGAENGQRINSRGSVGATSYTTGAYDSYTKLDEERFNLMNESPGAQGSGRNWVGDVFNPTRARSYDFNLPELITSEPIRARIRLAVRSRQAATSIVEVNGQSFSRTAAAVSWNNLETLYAQTTFIEEDILVNSEDFTFNISCPSVGDGTNLAWLDYIEINGKSSINKTGQQLLFRDKETLNYNSATFQVNGADGNTIIWDISDPLNPVIQEANLSGSVLSFGIDEIEGLSEFAAFQENGALLTPEAIGIIENQNIHAFDNIDMAIIYHEDFKDAAQMLADHRSDYSGLNVALVDINQVFNEFASGKKDITALRDFAKMLYDRNPSDFKYLLLLGDASYDFKEILGQGGNFIPPFETVESFHPIRAFPSDDFFGLLTEGEGNALIGALDISVGRLPARTENEANTMIEKIIHYDTSPSTLGDWRNRIVFNADDEDGNIHVNQADEIAQTLRNTHSVFNVNKIYFDAYQQISTSGGARFPSANDAINRDMFKGVLVLNYMGHGGSKGWAQERVLTQDDISGWSNDDKLPLFVTATCSFTGYDEPSITSAGEQSILTPNGGVIALYTTTRAVYSSANKRLTEAVFDSIFLEMGADPRPIGEILRLAKNANRADTLETNSRKFTLIGDPAMKLAIPKHQVVTTKINDIDVVSGVTVDTIQALEKVTIEGMITDVNGNLLENFNGTVQPTIYDKEIIASTLGQDPRSSVKDFRIQQSIIFKGNASVTNGKFTFSFVVPKDINYEYGTGRISYYAHDGQNVDARGYFEDFVIGGTSPNAIVDDQGPLVEVFMNNENFAVGGITSPNPTLFVKISDDNGINVAGNSIGHDLTGVLDENTQNTYILNDFYEAALDDYTKGEVSFPLFSLAEGIHRIKVKAWDIANNSGEGFTEFVVASDEDIALDFVLNYPNPFTTCTNFQFEHNVKDQGLEVQIQIFTVSGKLVKTIDEQLFTDGGRVSGIKWDGTDDYGGQLAKGVYLYKVKVRSEDLKTSESDFEKLVILK